MSLDGHMAEVWVASLFPDGKQAITGAGTASCWCGTSRAASCCRQFESSGDLPRCLAWSPDGKRVAIGHYAADPCETSRATLRIWDVASGKQVWAATGHTGAITAVAWSCDGKRIATSSFDKSVRLWDAATGKQEKHLLVSDQGSDSVAFTPDGAPIGDRRMGNGYHDTTVGGGHRQGIGPLRGPHGKCAGGGSHPRRQPGLVMLKGRHPAAVGLAGTSPRLQLRRSHASTCKGRQASRFLRRVVVTPNESEQGDGTVEAPASPLAQVSVRK